MEEPSDPTQKKALEAENLVKIYGSNQAVKGISFQINKNEKFGLLGPNGAGKSSTFNMATMQMRRT